MNCSAMTIEMLDTISMESGRQRDNKISNTPKRSRTLTEPELLKRKEARVKVLVKLVREFNTTIAKAANSAVRALKSSRHPVLSAVTTIMTATSRIN